MTFNAKLADHVVAAIEQLKLTGDFHGKPFTLMPWTKEIIRDVYGTLNERGGRQYQYIYITCAKKNINSSLMASWLTKF